MIRLVIADDEPVILSGIKNMFDWGALDIELVGWCETGDALWSMVEAHKCDIVISDIFMPGKTGLDIIKMIKQKMLGVQVIFISGFSEFSYAQEAVRYGAVDYITKPIDKDILLRAIMKAVNMLPRVSNSSELRDFLIDFDIIDKMEVMKNPNVESIDQFAGGTEFDYFTMLLVRIDQIKEDTQEYDLIKFSLFAKLEQYVIGNAIVFHKKKYICILINHEGNNHTNIYKLAMNIHKMVKNETGQIISVLIGNTVEGMGRITASFDSAVELENYAYYLGSGLVLDETHLPKDSSKTEFEELSQQEKLLLHSILVSNHQEQLARAIQVTDLIYDITYGKPDLTHNYVFALFKFIMQGILENTNSGLSEKLKEISESLNSQIVGATFFEDLRKIIVENITKIAEFVESNGLRMPPEIEQVKSYVEENYSEEITLKKMADMVYMNSFYFSGFFKKHTKINFKEYLTKVRMEKAEYLLKTTNLKAYEVAEKVGFGNSQHFSNMFKACYGMSPMEYRKNHS